MSVEHVQTKREIEQILAASALAPRKRLGQHFLIDGNLMRRLADSAELTPDEIVLEVGPGTGGLTDLLVGRSGTVVLVEIDRGLCDVLARRFAESPTLTLLRGDVLASKHKLRGDLVERLRSAGAAGQTVKLVANLPYQIATPLVMNLLADFPEVRRLCFTVQADVGARIAAVPGSKAYGPLSIITQTLARITTVATLPSTAFWPRPKVASVMIRLDLTDSPFDDRSEVSAFASLVRAVFDHRRKTLRSALGYVLDGPNTRRVCSALDATRRPEMLSVSQWLDLYRLARRP